MKYSIFYKALHFPFKELNSAREEESSTCGVLPEQGHQLQEDDTGTVAPESLARQEEEMWRAKRQKRVPSSLPKKSSKYVGTDRTLVRDMLQWKRVQGMPVMENGKSRGSITINSRKISLTNTCAMDSLFQLLLALGFDRHEFKEWVNFETYINLEICCG